MTKTPVLDDERLRARSREERNDAENAYLDAIHYLLSGRKPNHPRNLEKWRKGTLRLTVTAVADEADRDREPIGGGGRPYGWIWRVIQGHEKALIECRPEPEEVDEQADIGPRGLTASVVQLRSLLANKTRKDMMNEEKAKLWDDLVLSTPILTTRRRKPGGA